MLGTFEGNYSTCPSPRVSTPARKSSMIMVVKLTNIQSAISEAALSGVGSVWQLLLNLFCLQHGRPEWPDILVPSSVIELLTHLKPSVA